MSYGVHSDEVAEDYSRALEELTLNSRYEISNLTVIARENTEHALAISQALKDHIKRTAPNKKLPAFYVLDSVVKNVGTPYTIFLARNLYSTFMEAYALVDGNVRRKMEEMLKTWKEPVPGSIESRPVFPVDTTRPIETALIKYRTATLQAQHAQQQSMLRPRPGMPVMGTGDYRQTPTPPNAMRPNPYASPAGYPHQGQVADYGYSGSQYDQHRSQYAGQHVQVGLNHDPRRAREPTGAEMYASAQYPRPVSVAPSWQQQLQQHAQISGPPVVSLETLKSDIARLIVMSRNDFTLNPHDTSKQIRLKALFDLQNVLESQVLPQDQLVAVRMQVDQLSASAPPPQVVPTPVPQPSYVPAPIQTPVTLPVQTQPSASSLGALLGQGGNAQSAIAALLARAASATPRIQTPTPPQTFQQPVLAPSPRPASVQPASTPNLTPAVPATAPANPLALLNKLRASGLLKATSTPTLVPTVPAVLPNGLPTSLPLGLPPALPFLNGVQALPEIPNNVELTAASIKTPRKYLIDAFYSRLGQPCTQCGQRFPTDEEGKKKKIAHLDWHFSINNRIATANSNGQALVRSLYSDEMDWIQSRESANDYLLTQDDSPKATEAASAIAKTQRPYVRIPDVVENKHCSICQEEFTAMYQKDTDDYVWDDAIEEGGKYVHASCRAEVAKAESVRAASKKLNEDTSVSLKRKNEDEHSLRMKIKSEPV